MGENPQFCHREATKMSPLIVFALLIGSCTVQARPQETRGIKDILNKCLKSCPRIIAPVCDNEGITHSNKCEFEIRQCVAKETSNRDIVIVHDGVCLNEAYGIKDVLNKCLKFCPRIMSPVCDNEGITHSNKCEFEIRQCVAKETSNRDIVIVHDGVCLNEGYGIKDILEKCIKNCDKTILPVCDNEGITHNNKCEFEVRQCVAKESSGRSITIVHDGVCLNEGYGIKDVLEKCIKSCDKTILPVCDNEGNTHNNKCEFEVRQCVAKESSGRSIKVVHDGVCLN